MIGQGGFGKVFEAIDLVTGETVALKEMYGNYTFEECCNLAEVKALQIMNHPNIVTLKEIVLYESRLSLVYELLERDLYKMMEHHRKIKQWIKEDQIKLFML